MYRFKIYLIVTLGLITFMVNGCDENFYDEGFNNNNNSNFPAVGNTVNTFAFSIAANNFTFSEKYPVTFNSSSLILGLTVTNFSNGNGRLDFINSGDKVYYSIPLNSNIALGNKDVTGGTPKWIGISLTNFSGQLSIGIVAQ